MDPYVAKLIGRSRSAAAAAQPPTNVLPFNKPQDLLEALQNENHEIRSATSLVLQRVQFLRQAGITFQGARDLYGVLGYDRLITTRQYRDRYARGGIAGRVVDAIVDATWRGRVELLEDEDPRPDKATEFEKTWKALDLRLQINAKLHRADKLAQLSTYGVVLLGVRDSNLMEELPKGKPDDLLYLAPFLGGGGPGGDTRSRAAAVDSDVTIMEFEDDPSNPRFGLPRSYQLRRTDISSPVLQRPVHWSRILHLAEGVLDNEVYGQPSMERVWNLLDDLDKVIGGGAEAFWLRANQGLHLNVDKDMTLPDAKNAVESLKEQSEDYKHQITRWLRTRGVDIKTLGSDVANFSSPADAIITQIAGSKGIPKRILVGTEAGELASSQDRDNWKDRVDGRQTLYAGPYIVRQLADRLIKYGYLPKPSVGENEYLVKWPHMTTLTEQERYQGAQSWAATNQTQGETIFTDDEIRKKWYDLQPLEPDQKKKVGAPAGPPQGPPGQPQLEDPRELSEREMLLILEDAVRKGALQELLTT